MKFMDGENLGDVLKKPTPNEADLAILNPDIDEAKLDGIFEQLARFMLELSRLEFSRIEAISKDAVSGEWTVTESPLTYDMNEVVSFAGFPAEHFTIMPMFDRSSIYFAARAQCLQIHLETQHNLTMPKTSPGAGTSRDTALRSMTVRENLLHNI